MKRQASISAFFSKKPVEKKVKSKEHESSESSSQAMDIDTVPKPTTPKPIITQKLSGDELKRLQERFANKFGARDEQLLQKRQHVESLMTDPNTAIPRQKYTPLESQVVDLKARYPGCLLLIEVGYKFRFFGEDAKVASRVLHIANFIDRNFYVASIPVHRLNYHVQKLVNAGYKVGIVRQTETAALKAVGANRGAPFQRELTQMITKGTMVDEMTVADNQERYLMCLVEEKRGGNGPDDRVFTGMVAVKLSTGDVVYDTFSDTFMRSELETRLLHIEPSEILIPSKNISQPTEKLLNHLSGQKSTCLGNESVRIERMPVDDLFCEDYNRALTFVTDFYESTSYLSTIVELPDIIIKSLACLIRYVEEFNLTSILKTTKFFTHFVSQSHMLLNGNTLVNLEIYRNNTNFKEEGSLFSVLNHTKTKFGQRLLRKWVGRPLVDINKLNERVNAIEELIHTDVKKKDRVLSLLKQLPDIEKGLCRIHYGKASPKEVVQVLETLEKVSLSFQQEQEPRFESELLNGLFDTLPRIYSDVIGFKESIHCNCKGDLLSFFKSESRWPEIPKQKNNIKYIESLLQDHLVQLQQVTQLPDLKFVTVAAVEYQLEVPNNAKSKKVPDDWIKVSRTKAVSRYHTNYVIQQLAEREQYRELLLLAAEKAYKDFMSEISTKYEEFRQVALCLAHIDCLLSLATTASQPNYVKPEFTDKAEIQVTEGRHPIIERGGSNYVANDIEFTADTERAMILTGPNMGGKSSYIRQIGLIAIMGQIGSYVPARSARLGVLDAVYTRMGASDNMMRGESTFMVELHETSDIMKHATARSLVILDELGRGTSTHDGQAIAYAVLHYFLQQVQSITLFVTHYPSIGSLQSMFRDRVRNCYMSYLEEKDDDGIPNIVFLYKLVNGLATESYG
ncbi:DNA mismatch repair protein msh3 [Helicostylum pulchrum]|nr:DNA mismatch repair protein msh3 [Helicostylum pulchrum]